MKAIDSSKAHFFLTHNYSGYPVIREMRTLVDRVRPIKNCKRIIFTGLAGFKEEDTGSNKQAEWRTILKVVQQVQLVILEVIQCIYWSSSQV